MKRFRKVPSTQIINQRGVAIFFHYLCLGWILISGVQPSPIETQGVVIDRVDPDGALHKAGVCEGDLFTAWERVSANPGNPEVEKGNLNDVFDWWVLENNQAPRGTIRLLGKRDTRVLEIIVSVDDWGVEILPRMDWEDRAMFQQGLSQIESGSIQEGLQTLNMLADESETRGSALRTGLALRRAFKNNEALSVFQKALAHAQKDTCRVVLLFEMGRVLYAHEEWDKALAAFQAGYSFGSTLWNENSLILARFRTAKSLVYLAKVEYTDTLEQLTLARNIYERSAPDSIAFAKVLNTLGVVALKKENFTEAKLYLQRAVDIYQKKTSENLSTLRSLTNLGNASYYLNDLNTALFYYKKSLRLVKSRAPNRPEHAAILNSLGNISKRKGNLNKAVEYYRKSLIIVQNLSPNSLALAGAHLNLGEIERQKSNLKVAEQHFEKSILIFQNKSPNSRSLVRALCSYGHVTFDLGNLELAGQRYEKGRKISDRSFPNSTEMAMVLHGLGNLAAVRGFYTEAERYFRDSLSITDKIFKRNLNNTYSLSALGKIAFRRENLKSSEDFLLESLSIRDKLIPDSLLVAENLNTLGLVAKESKEHKKAEHYYSKALDIYQRKAPNSLSCAYTLNNLGSLNIDIGNYKKAKDFLDSALITKTTRAPDSQCLANTICLLGLLAFKQDDLNKSERLFKQAIDIRKPYGFNNQDAVLNFSNLGMVYRKQGNASLARKYYNKSLLTLEDSLAVFGGSQVVKTNFIAKNQRFYREYIDFLLDQGELEQAFNIFERSRARILRDLLAERDLVLSGEFLPQSLDRKRQKLAYQYEHIYLSSIDKETKNERMQETLTEIRNEYEEVKRLIREQSPSLAALRYPEPLKFNAVREMLDPGSTLLSFCLLKDKTVIFMIQPSAPIQVEIIPKGEFFFREKIHTFIRYSNKRTLSHLERKMAHREGFNLFDSLFYPFYPHIKKTKHLIIIPDGPLWFLPFSILPTTPGIEVPKYLIEYTPISSVVSASLLRDLKQRKKRNSRELIAFGDPVYHSLKGITEKDKGFEDPRANRFFRDGAFAPLFYSSTEVRGISQIFDTRLYLREQASEPNAKAIGREPSLVHFACHGRWDTQSPLDSWLALTLNPNFTVGGDNGILHAWEIFEDLRIDADLVVLSACESGLGQQSAGEGLIGLSRAFQFAGARSIVASWWKVNDATTSVFMKRFYAHLKAGHATDEALRLTQLEFIRGPINVPRSGWKKWLPPIRVDASQPYFWGAFQLLGPWD